MIVCAHIGLKFDVYFHSFVRFCGGDCALFVCIQVPAPQRLYLKLRDYVIIGVYMICSAVSYNSLITLCIRLHFISNFLLTPPPQGSEGVTVKNNNLSAEMSTEPQG